MSGPTRLLLAGSVTLAMAICPAPLVAENLIQNPSAEQVREGKPVGWGFYRGKGNASWGVAEEGRGGGRCAFLKLEQFGVWQGEPYANVGVLAADTDGYSGAKAHVATPNTEYEVSFWLKGDLAWVDVQAYLWSSDAGDVDSRGSTGTTLGRIVPELEWQLYTGTFMTRGDTKRLALHFHVAGHKSKGMAPGMLHIDDVSIQQGAALPRTPPRKRIVLPDTFHPTVEGRTPAELAAALRQDDPETEALVEGKLKQADRWADKNDSWFLHRHAAFTPVGLWTVACPFHPERVRDFSADNFEWDIEDPWRLVCRLCKEEGREPHYYPNARYPDDGSGCYPDDEVWREDHDVQWSREHGGIPWDHWDGSPHGYSSAGYCYFFLGKCAQLTMSFEAQYILPALSEGYVIARHVLPGDDRRAQKANDYARAAKVALHALARAHLGDEYLARVSGMSDEEFGTALRGFYTRDPEGLAARNFPGYTPYGLQDGVQGDPRHPPRTAPDIYAGKSFRGDLYAGGWLRAYALIRDSYTADEEPIRRMTQRLLAADEGDANSMGGEARRVKKGKLEYALKPYDLTVGHSNNLGGRELVNKFRFGQLLGDDAAVDAVVANVRYYLRNYFTGDGLGREGSCAYTNCAWNTLAGALKLIYGYRGSYDETHPWWDDRLEGLNPYRDPYFRQAATKLALSVLPDGRLIPWMDSHVDARMPMTYVALAENEGGGIPEECLAFFRVQAGPEGSRALSLAPKLALPSVLHHDLRKVVLRTGAGPHQTLLSLDYAVNSGHWHPAPMDLILFAGGYELASDLGYFGAMSGLTQNWIRTCAAHNTCIIRTRDGRHDFMHAVQGDVHDVAHIGGKVQAVALQERKPDKLRAIPGQDPYYARTCALVAVDPAAPYVVDFLRVRGGDIHDYMFHSQGRAWQVDGVALQVQNPADRSLYDVSGFDCGQRADFGCGAIRAIRRGTTDGPFSITWRGIPDWDRDGRMDETSGLRLTMTGRPGTQVFLGAAPGQRRMSNADLGETLHVACIRRDDGPDIDVFSAVIEPLGDRPRITAVGTTPVEGVAAAAAVEVGLPDRVDFVLSNPTPASGPAGVKCLAFGDSPLETDARLVVLSRDASGLRYAQFMGGARATLGELDFDLGAPHIGRLLGFDDEANTLVVDAPEGLPEGLTLHNAIVIIRHISGTSTQTIDRIAGLGDGRYELRLRWSPHLGENYLRVVGRQGRWLRLQPPPSLPHDFHSRHYHVYSSARGTESTHHGEIVRAHGEWYEVDGEVAPVREGDDVVLTKLVAGRDTVRIPNCLTIDRRIASGVAAR